MQKNIATKIMLAGLSALSLLVAAASAQAATAPNWNVTGSYVFNLNYQNTNYPTNMTLSEDGSGNVTGSGSNASGYAWTINSGTVSGDTINFTANYTAKADAVTPQTVLNMTGTVAADGSMSGTWTDNYQGGSRSGTWATTSGNGVGINDTVMSNTYTVSALTGGMGTITNVPASTSKADFEAALSMGQPGQTWDETKLSNPIMTGDMLGVTAADGKTMATYTVTVAGAATSNPTTLMPTNITSSDATLNATNGNTDASATSFWVSNSPFVTTSTTLPSGVYSTPVMAAVNANGSISAQLSSVTGLPAIMASTTYYVAAWADINGTWEPGSVMSFMTAAPGSGTLSGTVTPGVGTLAVTSVTVNKSNSTADGTFAGGWQYVFNITVPTDEPKLQMEFADWLNNANNADTIPVANNMQISSAQADNSGAWVTLTGANTWSTPVLNMTGDLDPSTPGMQVQVLVDVAVPPTTAQGSYSTSYAVQTNQ